MTAISLRQRISDTFGVTDLSNGFLGTLLNPFWVVRYNRFPFRTVDDRLSMRSIFEAWEWPTNFQTLAIHPDNSQNQRSDEGQSIAACDHSWIFGSMDNGEHGDPHQKIVWRVDLTSPLNASYPEDKGVNMTPTPTALIPESPVNSHAHFGAGDYADGLFWLAVQFRNGFKGRFFRYIINPPLLSPRIAFKDSATLVPFFQPPWVSVLQPANLAFTSEFGDPSAPLPVFLKGYDLYNANWSVSEIPGAIQNEGEMPLYISLLGSKQPFLGTRIQGADFSPTSKLYLVVDREDQYGGGIHGFDVVTGCRMISIPHSQFKVSEWVNPPGGGAPVLKTSPPESTGGNATFNDEYQDIEVFDLSTVPHAPGVDGVIHLLVQINGGLTDDNQSIVHMGVSDSSKA